MDGGLVRAARPALLGSATVRQGITGILLLGAAPVHLLWWYTA